MTASQLVCGHWYCWSCLNQLFQVACADKQTFPPRCCGEILTVLEFSWWLTAETRAGYKAAKEEFAPVPSFYCASPRCSTAIPKEDLDAKRQTGKCPACEVYTCSLCRKLMTDHIKMDIDSRICPKDENEVRLLELTKEKGWRQCPSCLNMVEKTSGCPHISCICGVEFCYYCGGGFDGDENDCTCNKDDVAEDDSDDNEQEDEDENSVRASDGLSEGSGFWDFVT